MESTLTKIETIIYKIRDQRVILDSDLAKLYGVETKRLNEQVKRNSKRFPADFMFRLSGEEYEFLKSQIATSNPGSGGKTKRPLVFTENGVAMLSGVLSSDRAIEMNILIMRTFTRLRSFLSIGSKDSSESAELFRIVFERLDHVENKLETYITAVTPKLPQNRKRIGLKGQ